MDYQTDGGVERQLTTTTSESEMSSGFWKRGILLHLIIGMRERERQLRIASVANSLDDNEEEDIDGGAVYDDGSNEGRDGRTTNRHPFSKA